MRCVFAAILYAKKNKKKKNPSGGGVSLPSDPLGLNSPQAFVCLSCSIYTLCVLMQPSGAHTNPQKPSKKDIFRQKNVDSGG